MDDEVCNEKLLGLEMKRLNNNEGTDDLYNNIANIYRKNWYRIDLNEEDMTQAVGFEKQLQYQVYKDNDIIQYQVEWESSNPEVAKVDKDGMLSIVGVGKAVITCHLLENDLNLIKDECAKIETLEIIRDIKKIISNDIGLFMKYLADAKGISFDELYQHGFKEFFDELRIQ